MAATKKPGTNTGNNGGIFRQVSPTGVKRDNFATVADHKPPTTKPGEGWAKVKRTPDSKH
jgi:hypothetical protein